MSPQKIKVLIVEDSKTVQSLLMHIIESEPMLVISGIANDGEEALELISQNKPDVITMDIFMPKMDGFEATRRIMATTPIPILVISAKFKQDDINISFQALECGALAIVEKPSGPEDPNFKALAKKIVNTIKSIAPIRLITRRYADIMEKTSEGVPRLPIPRKHIKAIAIGASLGGPLALKEILSNLSSNFPVPIFVVQHIMEGFVEGFAHWLSGFSKLPIVIPGNHERILPGHVYIAPDGADMMIQKDHTICLSFEQCQKCIKPSVAKLFDSVANIYNHKAVGILLTGMGEDGSAELLKMKEIGALTIAQDKNSCLVFGMPGKAIEIGAASYVLALEDIAPFLNANINMDS